MTTITIIRKTQHYRRTVNGAWVSGASETERLEKPESWLTKNVSINSGITVLWPDGTREAAYPSRCGTGYPPVCVPADGRLSKIFAQATP